MRTDRTRYVDNSVISDEQIILNAIEEYLAERNLKGVIYRSQCNGTYLEINRSRSSFAIMCYDGQIEIKASKKTQHNTIDSYGSKYFDLSNPSSLQTIYEYLMNKKWK